MCTGAEIAMIGTSLASGAGSYLGGNAQADAAKYGANQQSDLAKWLYGQDSKKEAAASQYLNPLMPKFSTEGMPDPSKYFQNSGLDPTKYFSNQMTDPTKYFDESKINQRYDVATGNLNRTAQSSGAQSANQAGALAASRGFANPSGFTANAYQNTMSSFNPQFGALEEGRAGALQQNQQQLYGALANRDVFNAQQQGDLFKSLFGQEQFNAGQGKGMYDSLYGQEQYKNMLSQMGYSNLFQLVNAFGAPTTGGGDQSGQFRSPFNTSSNKWRGALTPPDPGKRP